MGTPLAVLCPLEEGSTEQKMSCAGLGALRPSKSGLMNKHIVNIPSKSGLMNKHIVKHIVKYEWGQLRRLPVCC